MQSLNRFKAAQADRFSGFEVALAEIRSGRKRGHWMWYVFPQLAGLGHSPAARTYAIQDRAEADAYLRDEELRTRLLTIARAVADQLHNQNPVVDRLMGSQVDSLKLVSSLTLFGTVARQICEREKIPALQDFSDIADDVLGVAAAQGYPPCGYTLEKVGR